MTSALDPDGWLPATREVMSQGLLEAVAAGTIHIGVEHVLMGICKSRDPDIEHALQSLGDVTGLRRALRAETANRHGGLRTDRQPAITPRLARVLRHADELARRHGDLSKIRPIDVLVAILDDGRGPALDFLRRRRAAIAELRAAARERLDSVQLTPSSRQLPDDRKRRAETPILDELGRDLSALARDGKLHAAIGREAETRVLAQILMHKLKANPVLVGEPGVGKTCIVEGLALRAAQPNAPEALARLRFVELQPAALVAGTGVHGALEERVRAIIDELRAAPETVLFLDELHTLLYAGASSGGAGNILKPALARGDVRCIGATTIDEYRRHIEKDGALERRFQVLDIVEPTPEQATKILEGMRASFEAHHSVEIDDDAIRAAVELSVRYMRERHLPDKALDLLDHACSMQAFKTLSPVAAPDRKLRIGGPAVVDALSAMRGIPTATIASRSRVAELDVRLAERVVGQQAAIDAVAGVVFTYLAGLHAANRPAGVLLFMGPSGVGKTELAKALAAELFDDEDHLIRIDLSEYTEPHSASRLIGAPPGYIGHDEEGQLTRALRTNPRSIVLFDEVEKAHSNVHELFLQIFDEGDLTDSRGRRVSFRETIVIMTSNAGDHGPNRPARKIGLVPTSASPEDPSEAAQAVALRFLRPEIVGRIDKLVTFQPLSRDDLSRVAQKLLGELEVQVAAQGHQLLVEPGLIDLLIERGSSETTGARHLRHAVDTLVRERLARALIASRPSGPATIRLARDGERVRVMIAPQEAR